MDAVTLQTWGAFCFGAIIGWYIYYINRYRKGDVAIGDITSVIGAVSGGTVTAFFGGGAIFGAYGIGLAVGFFGYFLTLIILVAASKNFDSDWFLDGRRKDPPDGVSIPGDVRPTVAPMAPDPRGFYGTSPILQPVVLAPSAVQPVALPQPVYMPMPEAVARPAKEQGSEHGT